MTPRSSLFLAGAAIAALAGGWYFGPHAVNPPGQAVNQGVLAFPDLPAVLDKAQRITLSQFGQSIQLVKSADRGWIVPEFSDYAARPAKVRGLLNTLITLRLDEAKTDKPEHYTALGVADPGTASAPPDNQGAPRSDATVVRVLDATGNVLAGLIAGHRQSSGDVEGMVRQDDAPPAAARGTYIRRHGDGRVWLTNETLDFSNDAQDWIDPVIVSINAARLDHVHITRPEDAHEPPITLSRTGDIVTVTEPANAPRTDNHAVADTLQALSDLRFTHVKPATAVSGTPAGQAVFATQDGLTVVVDALKAVDGVWLHFSARASSGGEAAAAAMNKAVGPWMYQVEDYKERAILPTMQLLQSVEHVPAASPGGMQAVPIPGAELAPSGQ